MRKAIKYTADQIKAARKKLQGLEEKDVGKTRIEVIEELEKEISDAIQKGYSLSEIAAIFSEIDMQIPESLLKRQFKKKRGAEKKQEEKVENQPDNPNSAKEEETERQPDKLDNAKEKGSEKQPDKPAVETKNTETLADKSESKSKTSAKNQGHTESKNNSENTVSDFVKPDIPDDEL